VPVAELERWCEIIAALKLRTTNKKGRHLSTARALAHGTGQYQGRNCRDLPGNRSEARAAFASATGQAGARGDAPMVAGVSAGAMDCVEQANGTLCRIPMWVKNPPPDAMPVAHRKPQP
jgi:hypothetical protein